MIQKPKTSTVYASEIFAGLQQTGIKQTSPGGKARAFADITADKIGEVELRHFSNLAATLLPYAKGDTLDFIGQMSGVLRIQRKDATVLASDQNFKFYVRYGTFGSINNGRDIVIPAGTRLYTADDNGPVFLTQYSVTLPADKTEVSFAAVSAVTGAAGSAPAGVFERHSFSNYADARYGALLVTNAIGIVGGRDAEDDDNYRYRISLKLQSRGGSAEVDMRASVLFVPGVQDVVFERKAGLFYSYVYGISPAVPASLLADVQSALNQVVAYPLSGVAVAPDLVGISFATTVKMAAGVTSQDAPVILSTAAAAAQDYIDNLDVNETFIINEVADRLRNADARILDSGNPNKPLDEVYIWRSRQDGTRYSRFLVRNYEPKLGERLVTENIADAIKLTAV